MARINVVGAKFLAYVWLLIRSACSIAFSPKPNSPATSTTRRNYFFSLFCLSGAARSLRPFGVALSTTTTTIITTAVKNCRFRWFWSVACCMLFYKECTALEHGTIQLRRLDTNNCVYDTWSQRQLIII